MRDLQQNAQTQTSFAPLNMTRTTPARQASVEQNVKVPFLFAGVLSFVVTSLVICLYAYLYDRFHYQPFTFYIIPTVALVVFGVSFFVQFFFSWRVLWTIEKLVGDLDGDGFQGEPPAIRHEYSVQVERPGGIGKVLVNFALPDGVTHEMFAELMRGILRGYGTSTHTWTGAGHIFSRSQFDEMKAILMSRGLACQLAPGHANSKWALTEEGESLAHQVIDDSDGYAVS